VFVVPCSAWIKVEQLKPYHAHKEEMIKINKGKRFQQAVDAVEDFLKKAKGKEPVRPRSTTRHAARHVTRYIDVGISAFHQLFCVLWRLPWSPNYYGSL